MTFLKSNNLDQPTSPMGMALRAAKTFHIHDRSYSMLQFSEGKNSNPINRLVPKANSNRTISGHSSKDQNFYFDRHGNRLQSPTLDQITWASTNMLQTSRQENTMEAQCVIEYHVYAGEQRTRKITETKDSDGKVIKIRISEYFGKIEKQTTYAASNQKHPQLVVNEQELKTYSPSIIHHLYIKIGHRQIARQSTSNLEHSTLNLEFHLSNHIDSSQTILTSSGELKSFQSFYPYGSTFFQYGQLKDKNYQYSGEEKDDTGLHYYGARYYDSENLLSWLSADPAGYPDGLLNRYTMTKGNPTSHRDRGGLMTGEQVQFLLNNWTKNANVFVPNDVKSLIMAYAKNHLYGYGERHTEFMDNLNFAYFLSDATKENGSKFHRFFTEVATVPIIQVAAYLYYRKNFKTNRGIEKSKLKGFYDHDKGFAVEIIKILRAICSYTEEYFEPPKEVIPVVDWYFKINENFTPYHNKIIDENGKEKLELDVFNATTYIKQINEYVNYSFFGGWEAARSLTKPENIFGFNLYIEAYGSVLTDFLNGYGQSGYLYVGAGHYFDDGSYANYSEKEGAFGFLDRGMVSYVHIPNEAFNFYERFWKSKNNWQIETQLSNYKCLKMKHDFPPYKKSDFISERMKHESSSKKKRPNRRKCIIQ